jgi:xylulose-5-phosphate/fructose-6-phosphate phosphoketolase
VRHRSPPASRSFPAFF